MPLAGFALLFAIVAVALFRPADRTVRSQLVGQPLPAFTLPALVPGKPGLSREDMTGQGPRLLNIFGSWCLPCIAEAPQLMRLRAAGVPIDAIAIRDTGPAVAAFLARNGDPYRRIGDDQRSAVQLALGSSGVPETFLIDAQGRIVRQYVGDIRADQVDSVIADWRAAQ
ncbi:thiol:disulfide interchange protein [Sphingomonas metalli]|uniref:Thiol:disulfide interchange protein n=2 Tax=Sphingomonas metalli TaxID=1779358 RepID=A0A916T7Z0_9SPHN|nr:thiol:disulfide interchange protein [Sphingomonas metalli]